MIKALIFGICMLPATIGFGQKILLANPAELIRGFRYKVSISETSDPKQQFSITTDNGSVTKKDDINYEFRPARPGVATLYLISKTKDTVHSRPFAVREVEFSAWLPCCTDTITNAKRLSNANGLAMYSEDLECSDIQHTSRYEVAIIRKNGTSYRSVPQIGRWDAETIAKFVQLETGDLVLFYNIVFQIDKKDYPAKPLLFEVRL